MDAPYPPWQEFETLADSLQPGWRTSCQGASEEEISRLEEIVGHMLPASYKHFLRVMGHDMGPFTRRMSDFTIGRLLSTYRMRPMNKGSRLLLIATGLEDDVPMHTFLDLDAEGDLPPVLLAEDAESEAIPHFGSLIDMLAWSIVVKSQIMKLPVACRGFLFGDEVRSNLSAILEELEFEIVPPVGSSVSFWKSDLEWIAASVSAPNRLMLHVGAQNEGMIRSIFDLIREGSSVDVEINHCF